MAKHVHSGRARIVVLVILIGALSAIVVPRLIHEPRPDLPRNGPARLCLAVPEGTKSRADTLVHITAQRSKPSGVQWRNLRVDGTAKISEMLASLEPPITSHNWPRDGRVEIVGDCLRFESVHGVGGDPGTSGLEMSFSLGSPSRKPIEPRIRVYAHGDKEPGPDVTVHIAFSAQGAIAEGNATGDVSQVVLESQWIGAYGLLQRLSAHLVKEGWVAEMGNMDKPTDRGAEVDVRALPGNRRIGSALLTIRYGVVEPVTELEPSCHWVLSFGD